MSGRWFALEGWREGEGIGGGDGLPLHLGVFLKHKEGEVWDKDGWWSFLLALADGCQVISCVILCNFWMLEIFHDDYFFKSQGERVCRQRS